MVERLNEDMFAKLMVDQHRREMVEAVGRLHLCEEDVVLVVARGDAPIAPPMAGITAEERRMKVMVGIHLRSRVVEVLRGIAPSLAVALQAADPCEHKPVLFASGLGASIQCATCDHGLVPDMPQA